MLLQKLSNIQLEARFDSNSKYCENVEYNSNTSLWYGTLNNIRMNNLPKSSSVTTGVSKPLDLKDDEGVLETTAFLYDPRLKIIAFYKTQYGTNIGYFSEYFAFLLNTSLIEFTPILKQDQLEKFNKMNLLYDIEVDVAFGNYNLLTSSDETTSAFIKTVTQSTKKYHLRVSADKTTGLGNFWKYICSVFVKGADKVYIKGRYDDDTYDAFDLINAKLINESSYEPKNRTLSFEDYKHILWEAYKAEKDYLGKIYGDQ